MRLFGGDKMDRVSKMMVTADMGDDMPIQHKIISKAVESAQHKVESINFSMRKSVLEYDDVMNKQRQVIYAERNKILDGKDLTDHITEVMHDTVYRCVQEFCTKDSHDGERDLEGLRKWVVELTGHIDTPKFPDEDYEALAADVLAYVEKCYNMKAERLGEDLMRELNTQVMLRVIDTAGRVQDRGLRRVPDPRRHHVRGLPAHGSAHRDQGCPACRGAQGGARARECALLRSCRGRW